MSRSLKIGDWETRTGDCSICKVRGVPVAWDDYTQYCVDCLRGVAKKLDAESEPVSFFGLAPQVLLIDRFVLFEVSEVVVGVAGDASRVVGKVALLPSWSENDVMIELQKSGYPTAGGIKFVGWPTTESFQLTITLDVVRVFVFKKTT